MLGTLGIEPRASRMLSGCDTTTPRAHEELGWVRSRLDYKRRADPDVCDACDPVQKRRGACRVAAHGLQTGG